MSYTAVKIRKATCAEARQIWLETAEIMGLSPNTIQRYDVVISQWIAVEKLSRTPVTEITEKHVDTFVNPKNSPLKRNTRANLLAAMQSFFAVCSAKSLIVGDPSRLIRVNKSRMTFREMEPKKVKPFSPVELDLLAQIDHPFWKPAVFLALQYGLRISDVAQLEWDQIRETEIIVYTDKRDKRLVLPLTPEVRACLSELPKRHRYVFPEENKLAKDPKKRAKLSVYFSRAAAKVGIKEKSFHALRHTFATTRMQLGDSVDEIRAKLGHSLAGTTEGYIHHEQT